MIEKFNKFKFKIEGIEDEDEREELIDIFEYAYSKMYMPLEEEATEFYDAFVRGGLEAVKTQWPDADEILSVDEVRNEILEVGLAAIAEKMNDEGFFEGVFDFYVRMPDLILAAKILVNGKPVGTISVYRTEEP